jgi:universal stress protein F
MYRNILVPVAFEKDSDPDRALQVARALAEPDARITVLHVMEESPPYAISYIPEPDLMELRNALQNELRRIAEGIEGGRGLLIEGHAGRSILEWATDNDVDCIVIASHRPGLRDYFLGSTASHVVRHAACAVHVLR